MRWFDPARITIALLPLAVYLLVLAVIHLRRRPFVTTGVRDLGALGLALIGFFFVGPIELLMPLNLDRGPLFWTVMVLFYVSSLTMLLLYQRPRLVIYNLGPDDLRRVLDQAAAEMDSGAVWVGETLTLPAFGVQLHLERFALLRNVSLSSVSLWQSFAGWRQLDRKLRAALADRRTAGGAAGISMAVVSGLLLFWLVSFWYSEPQVVAQGLKDMIVGDPR